MEKVGRKDRSSQPRIKGALWTGYMRVTTSHSTSTNIYPSPGLTTLPHIHKHTHTHTHTHTHIHTQKKHGFKSILSATSFQNLRHTPRLVSLPHAFWSPSSLVHPNIFPYTSAAEPLEEKVHTEGLIPEWGRPPGGEHGKPLHPVFLPEESHGQRNLVGSSP